MELKTNMNLLSIQQPSKNTRHNKYYPVRFFLLVAWILTAILPIANVARVEAAAAVCHERRTGKLTAVECSDSYKQAYESKGGDSDEGAPFDDGYCFLITYSDDGSVVHAADDKEDADSCKKNTYIINELSGAIPDDYDTMTIPGDSNGGTDIDCSETGSTLGSEVGSLIGGDDDPCADAGNESGSDSNSSSDAGTVQACDPNSPKCTIDRAPDEDFADFNHGDLTDKVDVLVKVLTALVGVVAVIMLILAGIRYSSAGGDPNAVASAKKMVLNVVLGLIAFIFFRAFLNWIVVGGVG